MPNPVFIHLFHGRSAPDAQLDGWGFNGPTIGPLDYVHFTYLNHIRFAFSDEETAAKFGLPQHDNDLKLAGDLVEFDGRFYGDFSVLGEAPTGLYEIHIDDVSSGKLELTMHDALALFDEAEGASIQLVDISGDGPVVIAEHTA